MEIKHSSIDKGRAFVEVTFESFEERFRFGIRLPLFRSWESWRCAMYMFRSGADDYLDRENYPQTVNIPCAVIGQAALGFAVSRSSEERQIDENIQQATIDFLGEPYKAEATVS